MTFVQQIRSILARTARYDDDCDGCGCPTEKGEPDGCAETPPRRCGPERQAAKALGREAILRALRAEEGPAFDPVQCEALVARLFAPIDAPEPPDERQADLFGRQEDQP